MEFDITKLEGFEWDNGNLEHINKHGINEKECEQAFFNKPLFINDDESHSQTEERFRVYGLSNKKKLITMIITIRKNMIRVISARDQSKKERKEFIKAGGENL